MASTLLYVCATIAGAKSRKGFVDIYPSGRPQSFLLLWRKRRTATRRAPACTRGAIFVSTTTSMPWAQYDSRQQYNSIQYADETKENTSSIIGRSAFDGNGVPVQLLIVLVVVVVIQWRSLDCNYNNNNILLY